MLGNPKSPQIVLDDVLLNQRKTPGADRDFVKREPSPTSLLISNLSFSSTSYQQNDTSLFSHPLSNFQNNNEMQSNKDVRHHDKFTNRTNHMQYHDESAQARPTPSAPDLRLDATIFNRNSYLLFPPGNAIKQANAPSYQKGHRRSHSMQAALNNNSSYNYNNENYPVNNFSIYSSLTNEDRNNYSTSSEENNFNDASYAMFANRDTTQMHEQLVPNAGGMHKSKPYYNTLPPPNSAPMYPETLQHHYYPNHAGTLPMYHSPTQKRFSHKHEVRRHQRNNSHGNTRSSFVPGNNYPQMEASLLPTSSKNSNNTVTTKRNDATASESSTKCKYKAFYKEFKRKEKEGYEIARQFAQENLEILPENVSWRVYIEMADLAKRENKIIEARRYYNKVNTLEPTISQGWLEYAKMEEECGNLDACRAILARGLQHCKLNESLMIKFIKHEERTQSLEGARSLLARLKGINIEKTWRTLMEGALLEARQGNLEVARSVFAYLMKNVPWYGTIFQEACRFEEKCECYEAAIKIVEKGLEMNPRYGPLWFSSLRLYEKVYTLGGKNEKGKITLEAIRQQIKNAVKAISKELIWKLYTEAAQIEERAGNFYEARRYYVDAIHNSQPNLMWKVWMAGARTELNAGNIHIARKLLKRAMSEVASKMRAVVLLECSRLEEFAGSIDTARSFLVKAKKDTKHEWKVFLESVLLEMRNSNIEAAIREARTALRIHSGTGRLWAVMIQLRQQEGRAKQERVFAKALRKVPKSGEVWCEGARIALNCGDFKKARTYLDYAIQFTPQYGDSFIEYLRLEIEEFGPEKADTSRVEQICVNADPNYGALWLHCKKHVLDSTRQVLRVAKDILIQMHNDNNKLSVPNNASSNYNNVKRSSQLFVNSIYQNVSQLSDEERKKVIFL